MKEHRRFNRADYHTKGYFIKNGQEVHFGIINISLNGILVDPDSMDDYSLNMVVPLNIQLSSSDVEIRTTSKLVHQENHHFGFRFEEIDVESMIHLRRLVELNSDSADQIAKELHFLNKEES
ncbi:MAG: PilZ domain-containing protein [Spirochaetales bacterium]|nr:PilZ domain-containing protein [Spirochaetales bacterium]